MEGLPIKKDILYLAKVRTVLGFPWLPQASTLVTSFSLFPFLFIKIPPC